MYLSFVINNQRMVTNNDHRYRNLIEKKFRKIWTNRLPKFYTDT